nr:ribonuclease H-like domain-containing protein [Tanacetum cinerariifolium]
MKSLSPQVVAATKLPILNPNEFDLWKMRIEQYFLMTDCSLWEVILNEQRLAKKNELKASGTLLMALPDKHQLKINIHKNAKSLMEAIEKRFGGNKETKKVQKTLLKQQYENFSGQSSESLDQIHDRLQKLISQLEILGESISQEDINLKFLRSLPSDPQLENKDLKQIDADYLEEMDLKLQMAMLTMRAKRRGHFARECRSPRDNWNKDTLRRTVLVEVSTSNALVSQCDRVDSYDWSFQADEEPTNYALMAFTSSGSSILIIRLVVYQQNENVFEEDIKLLKLDVMLRDNALVELRKKFEKVKKERDELKLTLEKFQTSLKNLSKLLESQINDKTGLGYDNQVFNSQVFNCDDLNNSESDDSVPTTLVHDSETISNMNSDSEDEFEIVLVPKQKAPSFVQTSEHVKTTRASVKTVLKTLGQTIKSLEVISIAGIERLVLFVKNSARMTHAHSNRHVVPTTVLTRSRLVLLNAARPITTAVPKSTMKSPRLVNHVVNKAHTPIRRPINHILTLKNSNFNQKVTTVKVKKVNAVKSTKGNCVLKPKCNVLDHVSRLTSASMTLKKFDYTGALSRSNGCSRHMTRNISYLSKFKEINGEYVTFGGNPKSSKITGKGKIKTDTECVILSSDFKLLDENHVLLRVLRENNMYNVDLKNVVSLGDFTCLFAKATFDESNLWHRRLSHINFKTMNKLVKDNLVRGLPSKVFENNYTCVTCKKGKKHKASWSGPKWLFDIDTLTQSMNYQPVVAGNQPNHSAGIKENLNAGKVGNEIEYAQQYVLLLLWSTGLQDPQNTDVDAAFDVKKNENEVYVSPSSSNKPKKHDEKAKREAKGKSHVDLFTGVRDLRDIFREFLLTTLTSPTDNAVSPNFKIGGKSSFVDPSQYPDDPDMPTLENIVYSDDEEDVGTKADFSNLETNISVSPILTTRVYKDHPVTQIIGELTSAPQTRSMERMAQVAGLCWGEWRIVGKSGGVWWSRAGNGEMKVTGVAGNLGIVLSSSFPMMRDSSGSLIGKTRGEVVITIDEGS